LYTVFKYGGSAADVGTVAADEAAVPVAVAGTRGAVLADGVDAAGVLHAAVRSSAAVMRLRVAFIPEMLHPACAAHVTNKSSCRCHRLLARVSVVLTQDTKNLASARGSTGPYQVKAWLIDAAARFT
jgi:hypothetical protein